MEAIQVNQLTKTFQAKHKAPGMRGSLLFDGPARLILYTIIPAAFIGALPVEFIRGFTWPLLLQLTGAAALFLGGAVWVFLRGLRHYESGSAIQVQM